MIYTTHPLSYYFINISSLWRYGEFIYVTFIYLIKDDIIIVSYLTRFVFIDRQVVGIWFFRFLCNAAMPKKYLSFTGTHIVMRWTSIFIVCCLHGLVMITPPWKSANEQDWPRPGLKADVYHHNPFSILIMMSQDSAAVVRPNVACGCLGPGPESGY